MMLALARFGFAFPAWARRHLKNVWLALVFASPVTQAHMQVSPTQVFITAEHHSAGLTLRNNGQTTLHAQVRVFEWQQRQGEEQLIPTQYLVASPPMTTLAAGASQLVRIVRQVPAPSQQETSYRLIIDEMPTPAIKTAHTPRAGGLQFRLRYSLPVFLSPAASITTQPILHSQLVTHDDQTYLQIDNQGNAHAQILDLTWQKDTQESITIAPGLAGYVLPGQQRRWPLPQHLQYYSDGAFTAKINGELGERILVPAATRP